MFFGFGYSHVIVAWKADPIQNFRGKLDPIWIIVFSANCDRRKKNFLYRIIRCFHSNQDRIEIPFCNTQDLKPSCNTPFTYVKNACIFRASRAEPRLFLIAKVKTHSNELSFH